MIEAAAGQVLNTGKIHALEVALIGVAALSLAFTAAIRGHAGRFTKVIEMLAIVIVAALIAGLATGTNFEQFGSSLFGLLHG